MTTFHGFGPGKKAPWKSRRYLADGTVVDDDTPAPKSKGPSVHTRFKPFKSAQVHRATAKELGLKKQGCMTHFNSEKELNRYLAFEKHHGRDVGWKDW